MKHRWYGPLWIAALIVGWEALRLATNASPLLMPSVARVGVALVAGVQSGELPRRLMVSLYLIGSALVIAGVLVAFCATIGARFPVFDALNRTLIGLFHPLPGIALLPVLILWFGVGRAAVLAVIVHSVCWPLLTGVRGGLSSIPNTYRLVARNFNLRGWRALRHLYLPALVPALVTGLKIAWSRSWRALISAEMVFGAVSGGGGIGWFLFSRRVFMDSDGLFAGIVVVMAVGALVEGPLLTHLERRTVRRWGAAA